MAAQAGTTDLIASYLTRGYWTETHQTPHRWGTSGDNVLTVNVAGLTDAGKVLARAALEAWSAVADLRFQETTGRGEITFDDSRSGATTSVVYDPGNGLMTGATVYIGTSWLGTYGTGLGSYSYQTYMHEIGHALGLGHPGTYPGSATYAQARWTNDSWQQTVMSYLDQDDNPNIPADKAYLLTPMMADIVAVQSLYGAAYGGSSAGNTTYGLHGTTGTYLDLATGQGLTGHAMTIFDEGGSDTIDLSGDTHAQKVSLLAGSFSDVYGSTGNLAIFRTTTIETYKAGSGDDSVLGNAAGNGLYGGAGGDRLDGLGGNDGLFGGDGDDNLSGGTGNDRLSGDDGNDALGGEAGNDALVGGIGNDLMRGGDGLDRLDGGKGQDKLLGEDGDDVLVGGDGADRLTGDVGDDVLTGGLGADAFIYASGRDTVTDFEDDRDTIALDDALWGGRRLTPDQVLKFASVARGDLVLDFGSGNQVVIADFTNIDALVNDLDIF